MKVLDVQRRGQQIGRLRIGQTLISQKGKSYPARLETFRFTTGSRYVAESVAVLYGGQVRPWEGHAGQFEVITTESEIFVTIPPKDGVFSMAYEMWKAGGCVRRCDSQQEQISSGPCLCPHAEDTTNDDEVRAAALERSRLSKLNPSQACALVTRISVMIPDLPGLGIWRLDTKSYNAALDIGDQAEMLEAARDSGVYLRAQLRIQQETRIVNGQTTKFAIPVLSILDTFRDLVSGAIEARPVAAQLPPAPGQPIAAITAGPPKPPQAALPPPNVPLTAQQIADRAGAARTRDDLRPLIAAAKAGVVKDDLVATPGDVYEELHVYLTARWNDVEQDAVPVPDGPQPGFDFEG